MAVVPIELIRAANVLFVQGDSLRSELSISRAEVSTLNSILTKTSTIVEVQKEQLRLQNERVSMFQQAIQNKNVVIKSAKHSYFWIGSAAGAALIIILKMVQ